MLMRDECHFFPITRAQRKRVRAGLRRGDQVTEYRRINPVPANFISSWAPGPLNNVPVPRGSKEPLPPLQLAINEDELSEIDSDLDQYLSDEGGRWITGPVAPSDFPPSDRSLAALASLGPHPDDKTKDEEVVEDRLQQAGRFVDGVYRATKEVAGIAVTVAKGVVNAFADHHGGYDPGENVRPPHPDDKNSIQPQSSVSGVQFFDNSGARQAAERADRIAAAKARSEDAASARANASAHIQETNPLRTRKVRGLLDNKRSREAVRQVMDDNENKNYRMRNTRSGREF